MSPAERRNLPTVNSEEPKNVAYLPFPNQDSQKDGIGQDWHPSIKTHQKMADLLVKNIETAVGWKEGPATTTATPASGPK